MNSRIGGVDNAVLRLLILALRRETGEWKGQGVAISGR